MDDHKATAANGPPPPGETDRDSLYLIETDCGPKSDLAALVSHLRQRRESLEGRAEAPHDHPFAGLNAYKQRLQAVRHEYAGVRLRVEDLEEQIRLLEAGLAAPRAAIGSLEEQLAQSGRETNFYRHALNQMETSRAWQLLQSWRRWRETASRSWKRILGWDVQG